jgi:hypothetical protein
LKAVDNTLCKYCTSGIEGFWNLHK